MRLYLQKDKSADQVYIGVRQRSSMRRGAVKKTIRATDDIALDFDGRGRLLGVDVANASRILGRSAFARPVDTDELVGVAEAAKLCRVRKPNFIRDFVGSLGFPEPVAELASGRVWYRSQIAEYLGRKEQAALSPTKRRRAGGLPMYQALAGILASDELAFRHNALTYFGSAFVHGTRPHPPSIEAVTLRSLEEDRKMASQAQLGDINLYVEAAWALFDKYSPALESYLLGTLPVEEGPKASVVFKGVWVEALQRLQQGEYSPATKQSFSRWLLGVADAVLLSVGARTERNRGLTIQEDPLEAAVQAKRFQEALDKHQQAVERLRSEQLVLEYISQLSSDEIAQFLSSSSKRTADPRDILEAQRRLERRLRELSHRLET